LIIKLELPIEITQEDELVIAICPVFNVGSQGETEAEALENAKEALEEYLEDKDVQLQNLETIFSYAISIILTKEERFLDHKDIPQKSMVVEIHGFPVTSNLASA
jgi:predicted RNase H-like HicB family nuclease